MSFHLCIALDDFSMTKVASRIEAFLSEQGVDEALIFEIRLVVEEVVVNVAEHGSVEGSKVVIDLAVGAEELVVDISDSGSPFDPLQHEVQGLDAPFEDRQLGGMGIHLVKEIMDEVSYQYENGINRLRAVKRFNT